MESKLNTNWSNGEIITIGFGHFGVECVDNFFQEIASEHGLLNESKHQSGDTKNLVGQEARLDMPNVCFNETSQNLGFSARGLVIDVNMGHLNAFSNSNRSMFSEGNVINLNGTASRDFASGYYNLKENVSQIMNAVQKEAEKCEYLKGFNIIGDYQGGVGSGLTCAILEKLSINYGKKFKFVLSATPGIDEDEYTTYNTLLSTHALIEYCDIVGNIHLGQAAKLADRLHFSSVPKLLAKLVADLTSSDRF